MASNPNPDPNVLVLRGEVDLHESPQLRERFRRVLDNKPQRVFVDLSGVEYVDSSGLATLIEAMQRTHAYGGKLALYGMRDNVRNIFHIARLDQVFRIFPDRSAAVKALG